jgi:hypothetical protein
MGIRSFLEVIERLAVRFFRFGVALAHRVPQPIGAHVANGQVPYIVLGDPQGPVARQAPAEEVFVDRVMKMRVARSSTGPRLITSDDGIHGHRHVESTCRTLVN